MVGYGEKNDWIHPYPKKEPLAGGKQSRPGYMENSEIRIGNIIVKILSSRSQIRFNNFTRSFYYLPIVPRLSMRESRGSFPYIKGVIWL